MSSQSAPSDLAGFEHCPVAASQLPADFVAAMGTTRRDSLVIPASALNPYVFGTLAAKYILNEQISAARWAGVSLVCAGVALVAIG